jgi:hypothetical protein
LFESFLQLRMLKFKKTITFKIFVILGKNI